MERSSRARPVALYQVELAIEERNSGEGKAAKTRRFTMLVKGGETNRLRVGTRQQIASAEAEPRFIDIGLKFDCKVEERDDYILVDGKLDLTDFIAPNEGAARPHPSRPALAAAAGARRR